MGRNTDHAMAEDVKGIMEKFLERFEGMFEGFDVEQIHFIKTQKKKSKEPVKLRAVGYPNYIFTSKPYIVEVFEEWWRDMHQKQKNLAVFHVMCAIPDGGFDEQSKFYGKKLQPDIRMYMREYAASGGVPNWMENPAAQDPMERSADDVVNDTPGIEAIPGEEGQRVPITRGDVESVTDDAEAATA